MTLDSTIPDKEAIIGHLMQRIVGMNDLIFRGYLDECLMRLPVKDLKSIVYERNIHILQTDEPPRCKQPGICGMRPYPPSPRPLPQGAREYGYPTASCGESFRLKKWGFEDEVRKSSFARAYASDSPS